MAKPTVRRKRPPLRVLSPSTTMKKPLNEIETALLGVVSWYYSEVYDGPETNVPAEITMAREALMTLSKSKSPMARDEDLEFAMWEYGKGIR